MYNNKQVLINTNKGKNIIKKLFYYINNNPKKFIHKDLIHKYKKERATADFISGMTDRYAINLYSKLK